MIDIKKIQGFIVSYHAFLQIFDRFAKRMNEDNVNYLGNTLCSKFVLVVGKLIDTIYNRVEFHWIQKNEKDAIFEHAHIDIIVNTKKKIDSFGNYHAPVVVILKSELHYVFETFLDNQEFDDIIALLAIHGYLSKNACEELENLKLRFSNI